jgi:hypothetical protein
MISRLENWWCVRRRPQAEFCPAIPLIERFPQDELSAVPHDAKMEILL